MHWTFLFIRNEYKIVHTPKCLFYIYKCNKKCYVVHLPYIIYIFANLFSELMQCVALLSLSLLCSQGRTVSCVPVDFSDWKTLIPHPSMCVGSATVTLLELSMEARHVHRCTPHKTHARMHSKPFMRFSSYTRFDPLCTVFQPVCWVRRLLLSFVSLDSLHLLFTS